jgi:hypothetical protein
MNTRFKLSASSLYIDGNLMGDVVLRYLAPTFWLTPLVTNGVEYQAIVTQVFYQEGASRNVVVGSLATTEVIEAHCKGRELLTQKIKQMPTQPSGEWVWVFSEGESE